MEATQPLWGLEPEAPDKTLSCSRKGMKGQPTLCAPHGSVQTAPGKGPRWGTVCVRACVYVGGEPQLVGMTLGG